MKLKWYAYSFCVGGPHMHSQSCRLRGRGCQLPALITYCACAENWPTNLRHVNHGFLWRAAAWWRRSDVFWGRRKDGGTTENSASARGNALIALQSSKTSWRTIQDCEVSSLGHVCVKCSLQLERSAGMIWVLYLSICLANKRIQCWHNAQICFLITK